LDGREAASATAGIRRSWAAAARTGMPAWGSLAARVYEGDAQGDNIG